MGIPACNRCTSPEEEDGMHCAAACDRSGLRCKGGQGNAHEQPQVPQGYRKRKKCQSLLLLHYAMDRGMVMAGVRNTQVEAVTVYPGEEKDDEAEGRWIRPVGL